MINLKLTTDAEKLKADFRAWLKSNPPPAMPARRTMDDFVNISRGWQQKLAAERFVAVHWPEEFGGRGLSIVEEALIQEQLAEAGSPQLVNLFGLTMVGPVLIQHGTQAQKKRFLPKILSAEEIWCQGFSEPEAGSDLAALKTQGTLNDDHWLVSGQKIWTSFARHAEWIFLLVRTDVEAKKHQGLSYFLLKMDTPGIDVRPLVQISGDDEFNEVFFDKVPIPQEQIVGKPGEGWKIAISTLMYERVILTFARHLQSERALHELKRYISTDAERIEFGRLKAESMAVRALALSHLVEYSDNNPPGPEGSYDKLGWSESFQRIAKFALKLQGASGVLVNGPGCLDDGSVQHNYLYSRGRTIAAGTSEIQRSIISERILGLPKGR